MRILVYEPTLSGHHAFYLRLLLQALSGIRADVTLVTSHHATQTSEFRVQVEGVAQQVKVECIVPPLSGSPFELGKAKRRGLLDAMENVRPEHVYIPSADHLVQVVGLEPPWRKTTERAGVEIEGLMMRGGFAYPGRGLTQRIQDRLSLLAIERLSWDALHFVDPIPYEMLKRRATRVSPRVSLLPDPVDRPDSTDRRSARAQLGVPEDGRYLGAVGILDERKGIDALIGAFADASLDATDRLLLVGQATPAIRRLLEGRAADLVESGRIIVIDRYVDNREFVAAISALDLVCTLYPHHIGSASIVIRAAAAGRPVLASTFGWLDAVVTRFGLGWTCDVGDVRILATAIAASLDRAVDYEPSESADRFVRFHSIENFQAGWTCRVRARLGLPERPLERLGWLSQAVT